MALIDLIRGLIEEKISSKVNLAKLEEFFGFNDLIKLLKEINELIKGLIEEKINLKVNYVEIGRIN